MYDFMAKIEKGMMDLVSVQFKSRLVCMYVCMYAFCDQDREGHVQRPFFYVHTYKHRHTHRYIHTHTHTYIHKQGPHRRCRAKCCVRGHVKRTGGVLVHALELHIPGVWRLPKAEANSHELSHVSMHVCMYVCVHGCMCLMVFGDFQTLNQIVMDFLT